MIRWRHQALYIPSLAFLLSFIFSTLTRIGLLGFSWSNSSHKPGELVSLFAYGAIGDVLFALAIAGLILFFTALTHTRWTISRPFKAKRLLAVFVLIAVLLFIAISEFVFWNEFDARFNFVAVDYLIYTREVIGNIRESYSLPLLFGGIFVGGGLITMLCYRYWPIQPAKSWRIFSRAAMALLGAVLCFGAGWLALQSTAKNTSQNQFNQELSQNGPASFILAYRENELNFKRYYRTLKGDAYTKAEPLWPDPSKDLTDAKALTPKHVVLIEIESLSSSFMGAYGNKKGITPNLDRLMGEGLWFSNLYATGTRTVRGLEGMSAALPPLPGQSIVRRANNSGLYTLGGMLQKQGFKPMFMYGGYGAFDNMNAYFEGNGYQIRDRDSFSQKNQAFSTIWGVADELLFNEVIDQLDQDSKVGNKRFIHIMTTSNHRPYTYPEGRIDIPSKTGRDGAVKYTDWAIGDFIERAKDRPWFADTLFIIVADHNASVAGKQSLPPNKYLIPAVLYWPAKLAAKEYNGMASQIDLTPTVLTLLGIKTSGVFFGQNLLGANPEQRAYLVNYQELGYLTPTPDGNRNLIILGPKKRIDTYSVNLAGELLKIPDNKIADDHANALFQRVNEVFTSGQYLMH